jgi:hypothetical protein
MKTPRHEKWTIEKWIIHRRAELTADTGKKAKLFLVPRPERVVEQLNLDFEGEDQREIKCAMSAVLERTQSRRKPKVG